VPGSFYKMEASKQTNNNSWLHRFAVLTAFITFLLLGLGGLVTSHEAGMSVPDWPTSYGYNLFALPIKFWHGGAFFEHSHRLLAFAVGLLTTILTGWLWLKDPRRWMRWLGVVAFLLVLAQGVLGGLRVVWSEAQLGVIHGVVGQSFFILMSALALFTSRFWRQMENIQQPTSNNQHPRAGNRSNAEKLDVRCSTFDVGCSLRRLVLFTTILVFVQLMLGATMRGQHAGLAIPDFPTAYGKIWPDTSPAAVARYNADRMDVNSENAITRFQILLQMAHRIVAVLILPGVVACAWLARKIGAPNSLSARRDGLKQAEPAFGARIHRRISFFWLALIVCQIGLGAWTIWSNKAADVATLHLMGGALALVTGALWCLMAFRHPAPGPSGALASGPARTGDLKHADLEIGAPAFGAANK
jgi:cytochrome c oxidase assembly protein subunit 15